MHKLEIIELPERVLKRLEQAARAHGLTVEQEAAQILASAIEAEAHDEEALLAELRAGRESLKGIFVTEAELQAAKRQRRP